MKWKPRLSWDEDWHLVCLSSGQCKTFIPCVEACNESECSDRTSSHLKKNACWLPCLYVDQQNICVVGGLLTWLQSEVCEWNAQERSPSVTDLWMECPRKVSISHRNLCLVPEGPLHHSHIVWILAHCWNQRMAQPCAGYAKDLVQGLVLWEFIS